jgi:hypothetical protein
MTITPQKKKMRIVDKNLVAIFFSKTLAQNHNPIWVDPFHRMSVPRALRQKINPQQGLNSNDTTQPEDYISRLWKSKSKYLTSIALSWYGSTHQHLHFFFS